MNKINGTHEKYETKSSYSGLDVAHGVKKGPQQSRDIASSKVDPKVNETVQELRLY
jgi:hypothetical protein